MEFRAISLRTPERRLSCYAFDRSVSYPLSNVKYFWRGCQKPVKPTAKRYISAVETTAEADLVGG
jgi:hypothetical protein